MTEANQCSRCGAELDAAAASSGLCPHCLLQAGVEESAATSAESERTTSPSPAEPAGARGADAALKTPEELARLFPQLEIKELLGHGGMGAVYLARQKALDRLVALKLLAPRGGSNREFAERFTREARALARLNHPRIVAVYDFGIVEGLYFFLMEYVEGTNLRHLMRGGHLSPQEALALVPQICDALQYAHDEGVVHRDIKPENILLDKKGRVKIADFGLAKILGTDASEAGLTGSRHVMGTPHYMAPEQLEHPKAVDHRADIYSLGVVFYEMLTGELPLGRFAPPSQKVHVDVRLDEVVLRALEKEPERRYQHASDVKTDVEGLGPPALEKTLTKGADEKEPILARGILDRRNSRKWFWLFTAVLGLFAVALVSKLGSWAFMIVVSMLLGWVFAYRREYAISSEFAAPPTKRWLPRWYLVMIALVAGAVAFWGLSNTGDPIWLFGVLCYVDPFLQSWFRYRPWRSPAGHRQLQLQRVVALAVITIVLLIILLKPTSFIWLGLWVAFLVGVAIYGSLRAITAKNREERDQSLLWLQTAGFLFFFYPAFKPLDYFSWVYRLSETKPKPEDVVMLRIVFGAAMVFFLAWKIQTYRALSQRAPGGLLSGRAA